MKRRPADKTKTARLVVRCTHADKDRYELAAIAAKADDVSEWVRKLLNAECDRLGVS
jgi:hypothetical protein